MDSIYSDPAVQAAVHAIASHDPSIAQREMDELHTEIDRMTRERRVGSARFDRARWTTLMDELHARALKINPRGIASVVDDMHSSWYPLILKELETKHPDIFKEITSEVIGRNAERQVAAQSATNAEEPTHG
jgi:hypothetical protein